MQYFLGTVFRLKGNILCMGVLDAKYMLLTGPREKWEDTPRHSVAQPASEKESQSSTPTLNPSSTHTTGTGTTSGTSGTGGSSHGSTTLAGGSTPEMKREKFFAGRSMTYSSSVAMGEADKQCVVLCSEKQARVLSMPTAGVLYQLNVTDTSTVIRASIIKFKGFIQIFSYYLFI